MTSVNNSSASAMNEMERSIAHDIRANPAPHNPVPIPPKPAAFGQRGESPAPRVESNIVAAPTTVQPIRKEPIVESGTYAGKPRQEAVAAEIEKARSSVKAQRQNKITQANENINKLNSYLEHNNANFEVEKDSINAKYIGIQNTTLSEINRVEAYLRDLQERLVSERTEHTLALNLATDQFTDRDTDLKAMLASEEASLKILKAIPEPKEDGKLTSSASQLKEEKSGTMVSRSSPSSDFINAN